MQSFRGSQEGGEDLGAHLLVRTAPCGRVAPTTLPRAGPAARGGSPCCSVTHVPASWNVYTERQGPLPRETRKRAAGEAPYTEPALPGGAGGLWASRGGLGKAGELPRHHVLGVAILPRETCGESCRNCVNDMEVEPELPFPSLSNRCCSRCSPTMSSIGQGPAHCSLLRDLLLTEIPALCGPST